MKCEKQRRRITPKNEKEVLDDDHALRLIHGKKEYKKFSPEEKRLVNAFQKIIDEQDGGLTLPNTKKYQDEKKYQELIKKNLKVKE